MKIQRELTINASSEKVWDVLARQFDHVDRWVSSVYRSSGRKDIRALNGAPSSGRICQTELGPFKERIVEYDEDRRILAYDAKGEKMPFFVKSLQNRWVLSPVSDSKTHVDMLMTADLALPFNLFMGPIMRLQLSRILSFATEELKHFVETGQPHPRKVASDQKAGIQTRAEAA